MSVPYYGDFPEDAMVYIPFNTFDSEDPTESVTITNLADTDVYYHKDGSDTDYSADAATLVDIDFDSITGNHMLAIDTSENAYFATGSEYSVRIEGTTVDGGTINAFIGSFSIERAGGALALLKTLTTEVGKVPKSDGTSTWNATALASIEAEALDALQGVQLDHLVGVTTGVAADGDLSTYIVDGSVISHLMTAGADTSDYQASTDSQEGVRNHIGDGSNLTEAGGDGDHLLEAGGDGDHLTAIVWNSDWDAEVQSECNDALVAIDLDHLIAVADADDVADDSIIGKLASTDGDWSNFVGSTDSLQSVRDAITAGGDISYSSDAASTVNTGTETNDYTDTAAAGNDSWQIADENGDSGAMHASDSDYTIDVIAEFNMGANRVATQVDIVGYFNRSGGGGYIVEIYAYNYTTSSWDKLSQGTAATEMRDAASNNSYTLALSSGHTDMVTAAGEVKIGFVSTRDTTQGGDVLYLDYIAVAGAASGGSTPQAIAQATHAELDAHLSHIPLYTGEIRYVSKSGSDANSGHVPDAAFLTVAAAIIASSAGDRIIVKAGTYDEAGLDLAVDGLELVCEIGTIFQDSTPGTVLTVSGNACIVCCLLIEPSAGEIGCVVSGDYCRINDVYPHVNGATSWSITGEHNVFTQCRADNYSATGFNVTNAENVFNQCIAYGAGATRGFYFSHTDAHENLMSACVSINNDTGGVEFVSGADLNIVQAHSSVAETTPSTDGGTSNIIGMNGAVQSLLDDARTEPGDTAPPVNPDAMTKIDYLYKFLRNKIETTATRIHIYDDAGTNKDHSSVISDDATTFTRGEFGAGD